MSTDKLELWAYENRDGSRHVRIEGTVECLDGFKVGSPSLQSEPHSSGLRSTRIRFWNGWGFSTILTPNKGPVIYSAEPISKKNTLRRALNVLETFSEGLENNRFTFPLGRVISEEIARKVVAEVGNSLPENVSSFLV